MCLVDGKAADLADVDATVAKFRASVFANLDRVRADLKQAQARRADPKRQSGDAP